MKWILCLAFLAGAVTASKMYLPGEVDIDLEMISRMSPMELDRLAGGLAAEELIRTKRSGSGDILGQVTKSITSGIGNKLALIGQASAGATSFFSGGSSKGHDEYSGYSYSPPTSYQMKSFDFWTLKKSILNTLFQAVKAITGGVTILKGQLIKGGGAIATGVGKIISVKGEAVTNLGRHIVNSAHLSPPKHKPAHISAPIHIPAPIHSIHPSGPSLPVSGYGPPSGPPAHYGPPSGPAYHEIPSAPAPAPYYGPAVHNNIYGPTKYSSPYEGRGKPTGLQAGFILLQPVDGSSAHGITQDAHSAPSRPPTSFITSALQALKGIIGSKLPAQTPSAPSHIAHSSAPSSPSAPSSGSAPSAPSEPYSDPIYHPPPPLPHKNSYTPFTNDVPPFKPIGETSAPSLPTNSYGAPVSYDAIAPRQPDLQTMVDSLIQSEFNNNNYDSSQNGANYNSYLESFPDSKASYSSPKEVVFRPKSHLVPLALSKITNNVDKIPMQRSDSSRLPAALDPFSLYEKMAEVKQTHGAKERADTTTPRTTTTRTTTELPPEVSLNAGQTKILGVEKSVTYELRGNRIIRLTDGIADF